MLPHPALCLPHIFCFLCPYCPSIYAAALAASDIRTALAIHVEITTTDWTENQSWLIGLKRLIEMITKLGVTL